MTKPTKKVLLCLHGYSDTSRMFDIPKSLLRDKYVLLTPDFPMSNSNETTYTLDNLTKYILEYIKKNKLSGFDLFGFSLGGLVAINAAAKCREIKKLYVTNIIPTILINPLEVTAYKIFRPILISRTTCKLFAIIKTFPGLATLIGTEKDDTTLKLMKQNYYSIFGTMFNIIGTDLTDTFNQLTNEKHLFIFKNDEVINYKRYKVEINSLKCHKHIFESGGHVPNNQYWEIVSPYLK